MTRGQINISEQTFHSESFMCPQKEWKRENSDFPSSPSIKVYQVKLNRGKTFVFAVELVLRNSHRLLSPRALFSPTCFCSVVLSLCYEDESLQIFFLPLSTNYVFKEEGNPALNPLEVRMINYQLYI